MQNTPLNLITAYTVSPLVTKGKIYVTIPQNLESYRIQKFTNSKAFYRI
jgi:hypothetical protein